MIRYAIFGAGGFARSVMPVARQQLAASSELYDLAFVVDNASSAELNGQPLYAYDAWLALPAAARFANIAIADGEVRRRLVERCRANGIKFFQVQAANVVQWDDVVIGEGAILCPFVTLTSNIRIGRHFHANHYSCVGHDCVIGDFVTFAPGVHCNGNVHIEDHAYIGAGAVIRQGQPGAPLIIGRGATVGMGAVVTKRVAAGVTVVGNPARELHSQRQSGA